MVTTTVSYLDVITTTGLINACTLSFNPSSSGCGMVSVHVMGISTAPSHFEHLAGLIINPVSKLINIIVTLVRSCGLTDFNFKTKFQDNYGCLKTKLAHFYALVEPTTTVYS